MAKFSEEEVKVHKQFITIADMEEIVEGKKPKWETLRNALYGFNHYDSGHPDKLVAVKEAQSLIRNRALKAIEVISEQVKTP